MTFTKKISPQRKIFSIEFIPISAQGAQIPIFLGGRLFVTIFVARIDPKMDELGHLRLFQVIFEPDM